jgi:hypothetical protein
VAGLVPAESPFDKLNVHLPSSLSPEARDVQLSDSTRYEKIAAGVRTGMSAGMIAHQNCGFAVSKAAAPSIATTEHKRIAILTAHVRTGRTCMEASVSAFYFI